MNTDLLTTPLTSRHRELGAKMAPFAGYDMPVQYPAGILAEHAHTRTKASVFDICHMGEFMITGTGTAEALDNLLTHDVPALPVGRCRYGFMLNEQGGIIDDLIIYRLGGDGFMLVVNGARREIDFSWLSRRLPGQVRLDDVSDGTGKIDLQGPGSLPVLEAVLGGGWRDLPYFSFRARTWQGLEVLVSRTGYTGELGYELYVPAGLTPELWDALLEHPEVAPAGLGARDTLRLEVGLPLYGQDLDEDHTPMESGYGFFAKKDREFVGRAGLGDVRQRLVGLEVAGRRSPRHNDPVLVGGQAVGVVTSGSFAPSLGHCVALAWVDAVHAEEKEYVVQAKRAELPARRVKPPFYDQGTARMSW